MFDWNAYFARLALADRRERDAANHKHRRTTLRRSITQTIRDCAPLLPAKRQTRPRAPRPAP